jgi:hypothetical protein
VHVTCKKHTISLRDWSIYGVWYPWGPGTNHPGDGETYTQHAKVPYFGLLYSDPSNPKTQHFFLMRSARSEILQLMILFCFLFSAGN